MQDGGLIHARFEARALARPDALAISSEDGAITYGQLDALTRDLAARLERSECGPGEVVGILAERSARLVVGVLACARVGRPFVVLDLAYPETRLRELAAICHPKLLLRAARDAREVLDLGLPMLEIDLDCADDLAPVRARDISPDAAAYLLFTSGSTGAPKCVACSHRPLVNFVGWQAAAFGLGRSDRFTLLSGLSHDPVLRDIFTPLSIGASIHIPAQDQLTAPGGLYAWFRRARPTIAHMTPPLGHLLTSVRDRPEPLADLRHVFWGGDVLRSSTVDALAALAPDCRSVNFYGSTETPQAASFFRVPTNAPEDRAPIGTGIDGFEIEIRDEAGHPVADGESGEIVVRSPFLTLGYVEDGRLHTPRPAGAGPAYATGDLGYRRADGQVVIQGRRDDQVKVRGHRVELAEITACALKAPGVAQAITLNLGAPEGVRLCCFVQPSHDGAELDLQGLRAHIAASLPGYMVPDAIEAVEALPLLPNGKIDRQSLLARGSGPRTEACRAAASASPIEAALIKDWRGLFGEGAVNATSSFAGLGGDSLSYVTAYLSVEEALGRVPDGWTAMSIAELAATGRADARPGRWADIESAMLLRALAISAVVASHFQLFSTGGGATSALIWVSGSLFGGLQLHEMNQRRSLEPIGRLLKSLLIPLMVIEAPQILVKFALHYHAQLSSVLLYTDLLDYTGMAASGPNAYGGHEYLMWYVHCILHIILVYAALMFVFGPLLKLRRPAPAAALAAVGIGLMGRFVLPMGFLPHFWEGGMNPMSFFNHAPTTHLATFGLAALAGLAKGRWKLAVMALTLGYVALSIPAYGLGDSLAIGLAAGVLFLVPKLRVPRLVSRPVYMVAGASFFIYLLHFKVLVVTSHLHAPNLVAWPVAIAGGVIAWSAWNACAQRIGGWWLAFRRGTTGPWRFSEARAA